MNYMEWQLAMVRMLGVFVMIRIDIMIIKKVLPRELLAQLFRLNFV